MVDRWEVYRWLWEVLRVGAGRVLGLGGVVVAVLGGVEDGGEGLEGGVGDDG
jgi:hypothetical protein